MGQRGTTYGCLYPSSSRITVRRLAERGHLIGGAGLTALAAPQSERETANDRFNPVLE